MIILWTLLAAMALSTIMFFWLTQILKVSEAGARFLAVVVPFTLAFIYILLSPV